MIEDIKNKALKEGVPIIKDEGLTFLLNFIKEKDYKNILELGTAVGYSAINMARINSDVHIDTIEKNENMYIQAINNVKNNNLQSQIDIFYMPIEEYKTDKVYDFIFVDAAKAQYRKYLEMFLPNLSNDGAMLFDNMIFHGLIYDVDNIQSKNLRNLVKKIVNFREFVHKDERFDIIVRDDIGDGILILSRRK